jgi:BatD DUF11 like domain
MRRLLWLLLACFVFLIPAHVAWAQAAKVTCGLTADVAEVGEGFYVELRAEVPGNGNAGSPGFVAPSSFSVSGPSTSSTGFSLSFGQGPSKMRRTFTARWFVIGNTVGTYDIRAPTVIVDGKVVTASGSLRVKVVAQGQGPKKARPKPRTGAFGGFGSFFGGNSSPSWDDGTDDAEPRELEPKARKLVLDSAPDPNLFLTLVADRQEAMVGEQVTLTAYAYVRQIRLTRQTSREPAFADFVRMDMGEMSERALTTLVGNQRWQVQPVTRWAVFPLRAGKLSTGTWGITARRRVGATSIERSSNDVIIDVREPPLDGRPASYRIGDVGRFKLSAEVRPRDTSVGETVAVKVKVQGRGMLPSSLQVPAREGIEWLDPEKKESIGLRGGKIGGWRSFGYAVRLRDAGKVDLGTIELTYWDPVYRRYDTTAVELGHVRVAPAKGGAATAPADEKREDPFAELAKARSKANAFEPTGEGGIEPMWLWALVLTPPLGVALSQLGVRAAVTARRRRRDRKEDPAQLAKKALAEAKAAGDPKDAAAAIERAIHLALEAATGIKSRGVLQSELEGKLVAAGLDTERAAATLAILERCSALRFDPSPDDDAATTLGTDGRAAVKALLAEI